MARQTIRGRQKQYSSEKAEKGIINKIDLERTCRDDVQKWLKLVESKTFTKNLAKQDEASLIARGMHLKVEILRIREALDNGDIEYAARMIRYLHRTFGVMFDKKEGRTDMPGSKDAPLHLKVIYDQPKHAKPNRDPSTSTS